MTDITIAASKRFDVNLKVADIPATMADAAKALADVGGLFRTIDQTITLATARALIDATAHDAIPEAVIGQLAVALREARLPSGPAKLATMALAEALRIAKAAKTPMPGGEALSEAREITATIFDHDTKRRQAARAADKQRKLDEAAEKAAKKAAEGAGGVDGGDDESGAEPKYRTVMIGPDGEVDQLTELEFIEVEAYLAEIRSANAAVAAQQQSRERKAAVAKKVGDDNWQAEAKRLGVAA